MAKLIGTSDKEGNESLSYEETYGFGMEQVGKVLISATKKALVVLPFAMSAEFALKAISPETFDTVSTVVRSLLRI